MAAQFTSTIGPLCTLTLIVDCMSYQLFSCTVGSCDQNSGIRSSYLLNHILNLLKSRRSTNHLVFLFTFLLEFYFQSGDFVFFLQGFFHQCIFFTLVISLLISMGLEIKSYAPSFKQETAESMSACPEIMIKVVSGFKARLCFKSSVPEKLRHFNIRNH